MSEIDEFSKHEVIHTASIIVDMIGQHLLEHPAVEANPRWKNLTQKAFDAMVSVYQETATNTVLRQILKELIAEKSYRKGTFTLASGKTSNYFFDLKPTMLDPQGANLISTLMLEKIITELNYIHRVEAVGGMAMGAIPLVSAVSLKSYSSDLPLNAFFVRKQAKDHGTEQTIEGRDFLQPSMRVIILEDVTTTGGSAMLAVQAVRQLGCVVDTVLTVVDRLEGAKDNFAKEDIELHSLFTVKDFDAEFK